MLQVGDTFKWRGKEYLITEIDQQSRTVVYKDRITEQEFRIK